MRLTLTLLLLVSCMLINAFPAPMMKKFFSSARKKPTTAKYIDPSSVEVLRAAPEFQKFSLETKVDTLIMSGNDLGIAKRILSERLIYPELGYYKTFEQVFDDLNRDISTLEAFTSLWREGAEVDLEFKSIIEIYNKLGKSKDNTIRFFKFHFANPSIPLYSLDQYFDDVDRDISTLEAFASLWRDGVQLGLEFRSIIEIYNEFGKSKDNTISFFKIHFANPSIPLYYLESYLASCHNDVKVLAFVFDHMFLVTEDQPQDVKFEIVLNQFLKLKTIDKAKIVFDAFANLKRPVQLPKFVDLSIKLTPSKAQKLVEMTTDNRSLEKVLENYYDRRLGNTYIDPSSIEVLRTAPEFQEFSLEIKVRALIVSGNDLEIAKRILAQRLIYPKLDYYETFDRFFDDLDRDISTLEAFTSLWRDGAQLDLEFSSIIRVYNELGKRKDKTISFFQIHFANPGIPLYSLEQYFDDVDRDISTLEVFASLWRDGVQVDLEFSSIIEIYNELGKSKDSTISFFKIHFANPSIPLYYLESYLASCQNDVKVLAFVFDHMFLVTQEQPQDVKFEIVLNQFLKLKIIDKAKIVFDAFANLKRPVELPKFVDLSIKLTPSKAQKLVEMTTDNLSLEKVLENYYDRRLGNTYIDPSSVEVLRTAPEFQEFSLEIKVRALIVSGNDLEIAKRILAQRLIYPKLDYYETFDRFFDDLDRDISTLEAFTSLWRDGAQLDLEFSSIIRVYNELGKRKDKTISFFQIHFANPSIPLTYLESYLTSCKNDIKALAFVFEHISLGAQNEPEYVQFEKVLNEFLKLKTIDRAKIVFDAFVNLKRPVELTKFVDLSIELTPSKAQKLVEMTTDNVSLETVLQIYNDRRSGNKSMRNTSATIRELSLELIPDSRSESSDATHASDVGLEEKDAAANV